MKYSDFFDNEIFVEILEKLKNFLIKNNNKINYCKKLVIYSMDINDLKNKLIGKLEENLQINQNNSKLIKEKILIYK